MQKEKETKKESVFAKYLGQGSSEHGRSTIWVGCPKCGYHNEVYVWSFNGCGKKCKGCGVKLKRGYQEW